MQCVTVKGDSRTETLVQRTIPILVKDFVVHPHPLAPKHEVKRENLGRQGRAAVPTILLTEKPQSAALPSLLTVVNEPFAEGFNSRETQPCDSVSTESPFVFPYSSKGVLL